MTPYKQFVEKWKGGCGACICADASRVVFARGSIPCDVCFIGEAPGESENAIGQPFVGPAGHLLDTMIARASENLDFCLACRHLGRLSRQRPVKTEDTDGWTCEMFHDGSSSSPLRLCFTNLVGCIPRNEEGGKAGQPDEDDIRSCQPRLREFIELCNPRLIVAVGALARDWTYSKRRDAIVFHRDIPIVDVVHPAAILRKNTVQQGLEIQRCIINLRTALEEL